MIIQMEKRQSFRERVLDPLDMQKKINLDTVLTPITKINWKWTTDIIVKLKAIKLLENTIGKSLDHPGFGDDFLPGGSGSKESACNVGDLGSIPGLGRSPGEGNGYLLQSSGLENSMDCMVHGVAKSWTWLNNFHFHFQWLIRPNLFFFVPSSFWKSESYLGVVNPWSYPH